VTKAVIFDIEGTIGDIAFVRNVLFPYARKHLQAFLKANWDATEIRGIVQAAREASGNPLPTIDAAVTQFAAWIDEDRKITPLKTLQGLIWREGYESGELKAHLYEDAVQAMKAYAAAHKRVFIYSSGSVAAQKLYMAYSIAGNLTSMIEGYFDTTTGLKGEAASYVTIARSIGADPRDIIFFSDAPAEVMAAKAAGLVPVCLNRDGAVQVSNLAPDIRVIADFSAL
jgi:enolase-phosphatase E1